MDTFRTVYVIPLIVAVIAVFVGWWLSKPSKARAIIVALVLVIGSIISLSVLYIVPEPIVTPTVSTTPTATQTTTPNSSPITDVSTKGVVLEYPESGEFYETPISMKVISNIKNGAIYLMPKPETGNGNLGTVAEREPVQILAERSGYYFFQTEDGRKGWNWFTWFTSTTSEVSNKGVALEYPKSGEYYETPISMKVNTSSKKGAIYLMPIPKAGNGYLGTVTYGESVQILAERDGYYFFRTEDGRLGWNWFTWFTS